MDSNPWGQITLVRPDAKFRQYYELHGRINCPGQYQGVDFVEVELDLGQSIKTDNSSTVSTTIPGNHTAMFSSATGDAGNTLSGLFDVQHRCWHANLENIIDHGESRIKSVDHYIELLISQEDILLKKQMIVDMRDNPGVGFRNHTVPMGLPYGGTWSEDLTWLESITRCADINLSIEIEFRETTVD